MFTVLPMTIMDNDVIMSAVMDVITYLLWCLKYSFLSYLTCNANTINDTVMNIIMGVIMLI